MVDIEDLVEKFKTKITLVQETENYKTNIVEPIVNKIFNEKFSDSFKNISESLNEKLEFNAVNFKAEGKNRFFIEGRFHRIIFQKGKIEILDNNITVNIIPIYVWKGVIKHLKLISFIINSDLQDITWDIQFNSPEDYAKSIFSKLIDDDDFLM